MFFSGRNKYSAKDFRYVFFLVFVNVPSSMNFFLHIRSTRVQYIQFIYFFLLHNATFLYMLLMLLL